MAQQLVSFTVEPYGEFQARCFLTLEELGIIAMRTKRYLLEIWTNADLLAFQQEGSRRAQERARKEQSGQNPNQDTPPSIVSELTDKQASEYDDYNRLMTNMGAIHELRLMCTVVPNGFDWNEIADYGEFWRIYAAWELAARPFQESRTKRNQRTAVDAGHAEGTADNGPAVVQDVPTGGQPTGDLAPQVQPATDGSEVS